VQDGCESPAAEKEHDCDRGKAEGRVGEARCKDHQTLTQLIRQEEKREQGGYGEERRGTALACVELSEAGPQE
jgi:hypothetical protein